MINRLERTPATTISPRVQTSVEVAQTVSASAASVAGFMADKLGQATTKLGQFLAPHIQKRGSQLLSYSFGMDETASSERVNDVLTICAGAVEGFGTVYTGLEQSAYILGQNLSSNTVKVVEYKYGEPAGGLAKNTFDTIGNVINVNRNLKYITPKGLAKTTAKGTGSAIVMDYVSKNDAAQSSGTQIPDLKSLEPNLENAVMSKSQNKYD